MNKNVTAVILIVLAIGVYVTYTSNVWKEVKKVQEVNNGYIKALDNAEILIRKRNTILNDYNSITLENQDRLKKMLPTQVDNIRLIIDLNSIAQKRGLALHGITASEPSKTEKPSAPANPVAMGANPGVPGAPVLTIQPYEVGSVTVSFSTTASYQNFIDFMKDLEVNLRVMDVSKLGVKANEKGTYEYTVEIKTYFLKQ